MTRRPTHSARKVRTRTLARVLAHTPFRDEEDREIAAIAVAHALRLPSTPELLARIAEYQEKEPRGFMKRWIAGSRCPPLGPQNGKSLRDDPRNTPRRYDDPEKEAGRAT